MSNKAPRNLTFWQWRSWRARCLYSEYNPRPESMALSSRRLKPRILTPVTVDDTALVLRPRTLPYTVRWNMSTESLDSLASGGSCGLHEVLHTCSVLSQGAAGRGSGMVVNPFVWSWSCRTWPYLWILHAAHFPHIVFLRTPYSLHDIAICCSAFDLMSLTPEQDARPSVV